MPNTTQKGTQEKAKSVFNDLGFSALEVAEVQVKVDLWRDLMRFMEPLNLTQKELAERLGIHQPDVSNLLKGRLSKFSIEAFVRFSVKLGLSFQASIRRPAKSRGAAKKVKSASLHKPRGATSVATPAA